MIIRKKGPRQLALDEPIRHQDSHKRPVTRRDFIGQGMRAGPAVIAAPSLLAMLLGPEAARAALSPDLYALTLPAECNIQQGAGKIPFIAFDLAGGANLTGSEALIGGPGGPLDFLTTGGYARLGLPGDMVPNAANAASPSNDFINQEFGLPWHSDGAMLRGMLLATAAPTRAFTNGATIPARSENDTGNNPHNPMYGINKAGADGGLLTLIGSSSSDSGGNSMAPVMMIDPAKRPTKVDRATDVTGLVDTGELGSLFANSDDAIAVLESITRVSHRKLDLAAMDTKLAANEAAALKKLVRCGYLKSADLADRFRSPAALNPDLDPDIVGPAGIWTQAEYAGDGEFRKTAAVMKMIVEGYAGAGTVTMGGYDYHGQGRATGELRNFRAGRCIGACLEYAARKGKPLMIYIFSDGALSANTTMDNSADGRGKFMWSSDNQSTAASIMLVYNPGGRAQLRVPGRQQIGNFSPDGSVVTSSSPAANSVNLLVETVVLNYMALHGEEGQFSARFPQNGLGGTQLRDSLTMFAPVVNGRI
ncbi:MAG: general secretion pathway protein GspF [Proteobacteria bacterium]|nr:general secretion pathway protein GspF [Pseudomonadota bacterium]